MYDFNSNVTGDLLSLYTGKSTNKDEATWITVQPNNHEELQLLLGLYLEDCLAKIITNFETQLETKSYF